MATLLMSTTIPALMQKNHLPVWHASIPPFHFYKKLTAKPAMNSRRVRTPQEKRFKNEGDFTRSPISGRDKATISSFGLYTRYVVGIGISSTQTKGYGLTKNTSPG